MDYCIGRITLHLSDNRIKSNQSIGIFYRYAEEAVDTFYTSYHQNIKRLEDLINHAPECFYDAIMPTVQETHQMLLKRGIYDIDIDTLAEQYIDVSPWFDAYEAIEDQYQKIMDLEAKKDAHRVSRRQNRGRWHSGGFDLSSAIAGAAKAGAMNMATGAAHMAFNGVAKIGSSIGAEMKCSNIFNNARTYGSLEQGVRSSALSLAYGYAQCLAEHGDHSILSGFPSANDRQTAIMMMNNANTLSPHDPKAEIILQQAFQIDPYCDKIYEYLLNHHRNDMDGIRNLASEFYKDHTIDSCCIEILKNSIAKDDLSTEESTKQAKQNYLNLLQQLMMTDILHYLDTLDEKLIHFDKVARTFEGEEYSTREEAAKAKEEAEWIDTLLIDFKKKSLEELRKKRSEIEKRCVTKAKEKRLAKLDKQINKLDRQRRTVDGVEYTTEDEAQQAQDKIQWIQEQLKDAANLSLNELKEKHDLLQNRCRTDAGKTYIKKLEVAISKMESSKGTINKKFFDFSHSRIYKVPVLRNAILIIFASTLIPEIFFQNNPTLYDLSYNVIAGAFLITIIIALRNLIRKLRNH
ncbi:MAG: hypothetical protein SOR83_09425 [Butyricicoccus pullicaecorum]|nr:hypothetical protein [Butyricicoccus pullicaecorum]